MKDFDLAPIDQARAKKFYDTSMNVVSLPHIRDVERTVDASMYGRMFQVGLFTVFVARAVERIDEGEPLSLERYGEHTLPAGGVLSAYVCVNYPQEKVGGTTIQQREEYVVDDPGVNPYFDEYTEITPNTNLYDPSNEDAIDITTLDPPVQAANLGHLEEVLGINVFSPERFDNVMNLLAACSPDNEIDTH